ncbi:MAG: DUF72 domain-containing protein [Bryobacter sp.]|nr:DUF72 domain-containing protein [Bryobacter sp.]
MSDNLSLFGEEAPAAAARLTPALSQLAARGVYFGTSSWKYEGWLGQIYTPARYQTRGKFSAKKFEETCLAEYAQVFPVVCGDFSFYQFPSRSYWEKLFTGAPRPLRFAFKVPEELTVKTWPKHARYGKRAGQENESFLNADLFENAFGSALHPYAARIACLIFEFSPFSRQTWSTPAEFFEKLDRFLAALPARYRYAVEIRNLELFTAEYRALLRHHRVAHVLNAWTRMPEIGEQLKVPEVHTADFTVVRALLKQGRAYEDAVRTFEPYERVQEENPAARAALVEVARRAMEKKEPAYIFVNNRLEGNAPGTIQAVADAI